MQRGCWNTCCTVANAATAAVRRAWRSGERMTLEGIPASSGWLPALLPQALRAVIPALVGQFISLFKDTSLVFVVGLTELLAVADPTGVTDECSTVVALPDNGTPVAVQTWDWYDAMADDWFAWTIPHPDGHLVRTVTEYGVLGKIGVSSRGGEGETTAEILLSIP